MYVILYAVMSYIASTALSTKPIPVTRLSRIFDTVQCDCTIPLQEQKGHQVFKTCLPYMDEGTHGPLVWAHSGLTQPMHLTGSHSLASIHFYPWPHWGAGRTPAVQSHFT